MSPSKQAFALALCVTAMLAVLPNRWLQPWTTDLAGIVNLPLTPFEDAGGRIKGWLRPVDDPLAGETEQVQKLIEDRDEILALYRAAQLKIDLLQEEIGQLQDAVRFHRGVTVTPIYAQVTGRSPGRAGGLLRLKAGAREGVVPGTVAVYRGVHIIGRITDDVGHLGSKLLPMTDRASGWVAGIVLSADDVAASVADAPHVDLYPQGDGTLTGEIERARDVQEGDVVQLSDYSWPDAAQGMMIGKIEKITTKDDDPLRNLVVVRPHYLAADLNSVTLKIEQIELTQGGGEQ